jgi:hypothetical protein
LAQTRTRASAREWAEPCATALQLHRTYGKGLQCSTPELYYTINTLGAVYTRHRGSFHRKIQVKSSQVYIKTWSTWSAVSSVFRRVCDPKTLTKCAVFAGFLRSAVYFVHSLCPSGKGQSDEPSNDRCGLWGEIAQATPTNTPTLDGQSSFQVLCTSTRAHTPRTDGVSVTHTWVDSGLTSAG